jgi:hypothetical protein
MTQKVYRSARGKTVDLGAIMLQNENVKAVGNMGVNARGDKVDSDGRVVDTASNQANRQYRDQISPPKQTKVVTSKKAKKTKASKQTKKTSEVPGVVQELLAGFDPEPASPDMPFGQVVAEPSPVTADPEVVEPVTKPTGGLAAAIAAAKTVKQDALKNPREEARNETGVRRI